METAEGAMQEVTSILQRMRELAIQSASDTNSDADREFLQNEIDQLSTELDRIASTTQYNGINVLDGTYSNKVFQIGANAGQTMNISIGSMSSGVLGVATSNSASVSNASTVTTSSQTVTSGGATVKGTNAVQTVVNLEFLTPRTRRVFFYYRRQQLWVNGSDNYFDSRHDKFSQQRCVCGCA